METIVTVAAILGLIAIGALLIHRLNAQQGYRISAERHDAGRRPHHRHRGHGRGRTHPEHQVTPPRDRRA